MHAPYYGPHQTGADAIANAEARSASAAAAAIKATLQGAIRDARALADVKPGAYLVVMSRDMTPFRTDGERIALTGARILTLDNRAAAERIRTELQARFDTLVYGDTLYAIRAEYWAPKREEKLRELIARIDRTVGA